MSQSLRQCIQSFAPEHITPGDGFAWVQHLADDPLQSIMDCVATALSAETPLSPEIAEILVEVVRRLHRQPLAIDLATRATLEAAFPRHVDRPAVQMLVLRMLAATCEGPSLELCVQLLVEGRALEARHESVPSQWLEHRSLQC